MDATALSIRPALAIDEPFVLATAGRLSAFGPPPWRTSAEVVDGEVRTLRTYFETPPEGALLVVAEGGDGRVGFGYFEELQDYFTREKHGHIGILAVVERAEGRGVAKALIEAAHAWARGHGYRRLTLNVFEGNRHARHVYEHLGFEPEAVKYVKLIDERD